MTTESRTAPGDEARAQHGDDPVLRFGTELVTFYHPAFWGATSAEQMMQRCAADPESMWETILTGLTTAGVTAFEMTVAPAGSESVMAAFGSAEAFRAELASRGLQLSSGFQFVLDWPYEEDPGAGAAALAEYAEFVAECGGEVIVAGPPMRRDRFDADPLIVDLAYMNDFATLLNRAGRDLLNRGVTLTIHNEAHSVLSDERDIDLLMLLTDPAYVSLCLDVGNLTVAGGDPVATAQRHRKRIDAAHWKDAVGPMPKSTHIDETIHDRHREYFCDVGAGAVDWAGLARALEGTRAMNPIIFELDAAPDPIAAIRAAREYLTAVLTP